MPCARSRRDGISWLKLASERRRASLPVHEVVPPVLRQGRSRYGFLQQFNVVPFFDKQPVHFCNADGLRLLGEERERVSSSHRPFSFHRKVKTAAGTPQKAREDIFALEFRGQFVTGYARLTDHNDRGADLQTISNMK